MRKMNSTGCAVLAGGVRGGDGVLGVLFYREQDSRAVWGIPAWRELFQEGFWRELFQEVSGAGVSSWLGADVKVSFCFISSLWLQSLSLLSMCLWPFWWNKWDCTPTRSLGLLCSTKRNSKPLESISFWLEIKYVRYIFSCENFPYPSMSIFCPQDASHPFLLIPALSNVILSVSKGNCCHNFLQVLHLLPSLGSHCCRFVLCYSASASPSQSFCCVQQIAFCGCYLCEPCKMILGDLCCKLGDGREWVSCFYSSWWHTGASALFPVLPVLQSLLSQARILWGGWWSSQGSLVCWVCLSSVDVPVIALGGQTGCLLLLWLPRKCSVNSTLFFLMCSTSLWSSVELSWRGEQNTVSHLTKLLQQVSGWICLPALLSSCSFFAPSLPFLWVVV